MTVLDSGKGYVNCRVDVGGKLSNKKGVNTPTVRLPISAMTVKVLDGILMFPCHDVSMPLNQNSFLWWGCSL